MRKYVMLFLPIVILSLSLINCGEWLDSSGHWVDCDIVGDTLKEVSTDVTIEIYNWDELAKASEEDIPIKCLFFSGNYFGFDHNKTLLWVYYNSVIYDVENLSISKNTLTVTIPPKSASSHISIVPHEPNSENCTKKALTIKYPQTLSLSNSKAKIGDEITITATEPFFIEESFTKDKLSEYLSINYYIIWVESDSIEIKYLSLNQNPEKKPVEKEYYIVDSITPTSVTFKVPPYAKTGKVHVINEKGFCSYNYPYDEKYPNSPAYFSTAIDLEIIE